MSYVIGIFTRTNEGGWAGTIRTLTFDVKVRLVPNDNRESENAPAFWVYAGKSRVGGAWAARTVGVSPTDYLRIIFDGPDFAEPFQAALFLPDEGQEAQLVWRRRKLGD